MDKNLILVFDVGNTNIKYGLFKKDMLFESGFCISWSLNDWEDFFDKNKVSHVFIGNKSPFSIKISHFFPEKCSVILSKDLVKIPWFGQKSINFWGNVHKTIIIITCY